MTRETKAGIVVSGSFLCLVGVVLVCKMKEKPPAPATPYVAADGSVQAPADPTPAADSPAPAPAKPGAARPEPVPSTEQVALNILPSGRDGGVRPAVATGSEPQSIPPNTPPGTSKPEGAPSATADPKSPSAGASPGDNPSAPITGRAAGAPTGDKSSTSPTTTPPPPKDSLAFPSLDGDKPTSTPTPPTKDDAKPDDKRAVPAPPAQEKHAPSGLGKDDRPKPPAGKSDGTAPSTRPAADLGVGPLSGPAEAKNDSKADDKHPHEGDAKGGANREEHAPGTIKMPPPAQALGSDAVPSQDPGKSPAGAKDHPIISPAPSADPIVPPSERSMVPSSERAPSTRAPGTPGDPGMPKTNELGQAGVSSPNRPSPTEISRPPAPSPLDPSPPSSSIGTPSVPRSSPSDSPTNPPLPPLPTGPSSPGSFSTASQDNRGTRLGSAASTQMAQGPRTSTPFEGGSGESHGSLPPLGGSPPVMSTIVPQVESYDEQMYRWKPGDTFQAIARTYYGSDRYEKALLLFNRDHPRAADGVRLDPPALQADQLVFVPPANILAKQYPQAIGAQAPAAQPAPVQTPATASAVGLAAPVRDPAVTQTGGAEKFYKVRGNGEWFRDIARNILKDSDRWWDIARLNTQYDPAHLVPAGTLLRVPSDARIDLQNQP